MSRATDTIAALATPVGTSALAVIRASGPECARLAQEIFGATPLPRTVKRGDYVDRAGVLVDDVLFTLFVAPASYTGEDSLEISAHGNPLIAQKIVDDLLARGCRGAAPGEFTQRAFLNGRLDLAQAEAVMDVIHARSERALGAAHAQLRGALGRRMQELTTGLVALMARVEAYIDFPEEDLPAEDRAWMQAQVATLLANTHKIITTNNYGEILRHGIKTVIVGAPNAGKSSLLNRLVGRDRALVSPEPGTTRDFIEELISCGPHALRLIDTAGLNPTPTTVERMGIAKTLERLAEADLVLWVVDGSAPEVPSTPEIAAALAAKRSIKIFNKSDLGNLVHSPSLATTGSITVQVSALTGAGLDELQREITRLADALNPLVGDELIAINARHTQALRAASEALLAAQAKLADGSPMELLAADLRSALWNFGEIAGRIDHEAILDELFATFCIGK